MWSHIEIFHFEILQCRVSVAYFGLQLFEAAIEGELRVARRFPAPPKLLTVFDDDQTTDLSKRVFAEKRDLEIRFLPIQIMNL